MDMIYFPFEAFLLVTILGVFFSCTAFIFFYNFVNHKNSKDKLHLWATIHSDPMTAREKSWEEAVVTV